MLRLRSGWGEGRSWMTWVLGLQRRIGGVGEGGGERATMGLLGLVEFEELLSDLVSSLCITSRHCIYRESLG